MNRILSVELRAITKAVLFSLVLGLISAFVIYFRSLSEELGLGVGKILISSCIWLLSQSSIRRQ